MFNYAPHFISEIDHFNYSEFMPIHSLHRLSFFSLPFLLVFSLLLFECLPSLSLVHPMQNVEQRAVTMLWNLRNTVNKFQIRYNSRLVRHLPGDTAISLEAGDGCFFGNQTSGICINQRSKVRKERVGGSQKSELRIAPLSLAQMRK